MPREKTDLRSQSGITMRPILQITIPTFNRPEKLKATLRNLAEIGDLVRSGRLNISVFDNSDVDQGLHFGAGVPDMVKYTWNGGNLGYHGNIRKCLSNGNAVFLWLIADDDELRVSEIPKIVDYLENHQKRIMGLALPYEVQTLSSNDIQYDISLKPHFGKVAKFSDIVLPQKIPFDFLSSFIVKSELLDRINLRKVVSTNDYFHSLIYCSCLRPDDDIGIYDKALVSYAGSEILNWSLRRIVESKYEICDVLTHTVLIHMNKSIILSEVLKWAIFGRIGTINIRDLDKEISGLVWLALRDRSVKNLLLALLLILPVFVAREVAVFTLAISAGKYTSENLLQRLRNMRETVSAKANLQKSK